MVTVRTWCMNDLWEKISDSSKKKKIPSKQDMSLLFYFSSHGLFLECTSMTLSGIVNMSVFILRHPASYPLLLRMMFPSTGCSRNCVESPFM